MIGELSKRRVFRVVSGYAVVCFVCLQIADVAFEPLGIGQPILKIVIAVMLLALPIVTYIAWVFDISPDHSIQRISGKRPQIEAAVTVFAVLLLGVGCWMVLAPENTGNTGTGIETVEVPIAEDAELDVTLRNSIAVLPFENLSPDPDNAYFAAGIHEEVLNQLAKIEDLSVIARGTMTRYINSDKSIPVIGKELNVVTVMQGSVRYAGDRVRITTQLIDAKSGTQLWSEAYEDSLEDIFRIQLVIASQIATTLEAEFSPQEQERIGRKLTNSPKAYAHYLRALSGFGNFAAMGPTHEALDAAISLDPEFAEALAFKAWIYGIESQFGILFSGGDFDAEDEARLVNLTEQFAIRALQLDDQQALAQNALSSVHIHYREWDKEQKASRRAYDLAPLNYLVIATGAVLALTDGDRDKATRVADHAVSLNPADAANVWFYTDLFYNNRMWDEAIQKADLIVTLMPEMALGYAQLSRIYAKLGNQQEMHRNAKLAETRNPSVSDLMVIALAYGHIGALSDARRIYDLAKSSGNASSLNNEALLWFSIAIGDTDAAMEYLEQGVQSNFPSSLILDLNYVSHKPDYDSIRSRPEFDTLRQQILKPLR